MSTNLRKRLRNLKQQANNEYPRDAFRTVRDSIRDGYLFSAH